MSAAPILQLLRDGEAISEYPIEGEVVFGRDPQCVIRMDDRKISRKHVAFRPTSQGLQFVKRSQFGEILLNGASCEEGLISEKDVIEIGPYLMRIKLGSQSDSSEQISPEYLPPPPTEDLDAEPVVPVAVAEESKLLESPPFEEQKLEMTAHELQPPAAAEEPKQEEVPNQNQTAEPSKDGAPLSMGEPNYAELSKIANPSESTRVLSSSERPVLKLIFRPGDSNVVEYSIEKAQVSIGRGKNCDIVLNDRKASRKSAVIVFEDGKYFIRDQGSLNGIFVNNEKVAQAELLADEDIRIGDIDFRVLGVDPDFEKKKESFLQLPSQKQEMVFDGMSKVGLAYPQAFNPAPMGMPGNTLEPAMPVSSNVSGKKAAWNDLPQRKRILYLVVIAALAWTLLDEDEAPETPKPKKQPKTAVVQKSAKDKIKGFEDLTAEQKAFVESQHRIAFEYLKGRDYDKAIFEVRKIFPLINDFKDARQIERIALEGKRQLEIIAEERKRKEEEDRVKAKIAEAIAVIEKTMAEKKFDEAQILMTNLLAMDPENPNVDRWRQLIESERQRKQLAADEAALRKKKIAEGRKIFAEGMRVVKRGKCTESEKVFGRISGTGTPEKNLTVKGRAAVKECRLAYIQRREALMQEAREVERSGDLKKAIIAYQSVLATDPDWEEPRQAIAQIRSTLREKARFIYTEAVLAESFGDYDTARKKFEEAAQTAAPGDIYESKSQAKLRKYYLMRVPAAFGSSNNER